MATSVESDLLTHEHPYEPGLGLYRGVLLNFIFVATAGFERPDATIVVALDDGANQHFPVMRSGDLFAHLAHHVGDEIVFYLEEVNGESCDDAHEPMVRDFVSIGAVLPS